MLNMIFLLRSILRLVYGLACDLFWRTLHVHLKRIGILLFWDGVSLCVHVCECVWVCTLSHVWLFDPMDCSPPGSSVHRILQARILEWVAIPFSILLPSIFPSIRVFSSESVLHIRWPEYWSLASASVLPVYIQGWFPLGLIFGVDWGNQSMNSDYILIKSLQPSDSFKISISY